MMICLKCKTRNPIGNKFCKECGASLPLEANPLALEEANRVEEERKQEQVAELLTRAFGFSENNQVEKALPLVQEAIALLPHSTAAHSLLATVYERLDEPERAVAAMKRVVELNPESAADRTKLERMQRGVHILPKPETKKNPSVLPLALSCVMGAAVLAMGIIFTNSKNNTPTSVNVANNTNTTKKPLLLSEPLNTGSPTSPTNIGVGSPGVMATKPVGVMQPPPGRPDPFAPLNPIAPTPIPPLQMGDTHAPLPAPGKKRGSSSNARPRQLEMTRPKSEPPAIIIVPQGTPLPNPDASPPVSIPARRPDTANGTPETATSPKKDTTSPKKEESYIRIKVRQMTPEEREIEQERLRKQREREGQEENTNENTTTEGGN
jgi:ribosomal protein L40E